jgi:peptidyl-prolyl cis-trans isomerase D
MAVLSTIRKRVGLLIGFVGVSMVLFILGDVLSSNQSMFGGNSNVLGEIGGEEITYQEFEKRVEQMIENYKISSGQENVDQNTTDMLREQAWTMVLNENILGKEYEKLGLSCSADELYDMCVGKNIHPQVRQAFTDPKTGMFNPAEVTKFLKDLPNREEKVQRQWKTFEDAIRDERISQKYKDLIKGGLFATKEEAKTDYNDKNRTVNIRFVQLNYMSVADSTVKVEDSDLNKYYNEHQHLFKQVESVRKIDYVTFNVAPSADDRNEALAYVTSRKESFAASTNDTVFVSQNSDAPFDSSYHAKGSLSPALDSVFFSAAIGTMVGPYEEAGKFKISKLSGNSMIPDSVKARHILIKVNNNDVATAKAKADSLKNLVSKGTDFTFLAMTNSEDPGSQMKGGDLGWFRKGMMVKPFEDACFNGKKGELSVVESQFGIHLIEVTDKGALTKQVQVATIERTIEPSQKTFDEAYSNATKFAVNNQEAESFDSSAAREGLNKRTADNIRENDKSIAGLEQPREIVRWAFGAKTGDVSKVFTLGNMYVVAQLVDIKEKGILPLEQVKDQVTAGAMRDKKAEILIEKMNTQSAGASTIDAVATKLGQSPFPAENVSFSSGYVQGIGNEPRVIGTAFAMTPGKISKAIKGENGVYIIAVDKFNDPAQLTDIAAAQKQMADSRKQRSEYEVFNALKEKANVIDNRGRFY